ncbi:MAG TPA: squalene/phytoene synthase family protein [Kofleriaceae bacterium]|nr:squalene/phytoene synthase family protein [Kofleriaceae bacterium]
MARRLAGGKAAPLSFWQKLAARSQSNLYFALVFLDGERREAFRDVYRFVRAADDVADGSASAAEAHAGLAEWRSQLDAVYAGRAAHPHAQRLASAVRRFDLPRAGFDTLLDGLERDIDQTRHPDWASLRAYCEAVASSLAALCLRILGARGPAAERYARDVGVALQLANILRDLGDDAARGHVYLPEDELAAAGASADDLAAGRFGPGHATVCRTLAGRARALIAGARAELDAPTRRALLVPEIWADVYLELLDELERIGFDVLAHRPYLHRRRKLYLALRRVAREVPARLSRSA